MTEKGQTVTDRPTPTPRGEENIYFEEARAHRLAFQQCESCGARVFYPRTVCPVCLSDRLSLRQAAGTGTVHSFTTLHRAGHPGLADRVPYTVVLVDLDEGVRVLADLVVSPEADVPWIGMPVQAVFDEVTPELTLPRFQATAGAR